jgi:hypothetical protein
MKIRSLVSLFDVSYGAGYEVTMIIRDGPKVLSVEFLDDNKEVWFLSPDEYEVVEE